MPFTAIINDQQRPAKCPESAADLLIHPIRNDPTAPRTTADVDWVKEHGKKPRFYVGGLSWLVEKTAITTETIAGFRSNAAEKVSRLGWRENITENVLVRQQMKGHWGAIARQKYYDVAKGRPVLFSKAALFIVSCELALEDMIGKKSLSIVSGAEVYRRMAIVPACWHVARFDRDYLKEQTTRHVTFMTDLIKYVEQAREEVIEDVSSGLTVTYETAKLISDFCTNHDLNGAPRCSVGRSNLGTQRASEHEIVSLND